MSITNSLVASDEALRIAHHGLADARVVQQIVADIIAGTLPVNSPKELRELEIPCTVEELQAEDKSKLCTMYAVAYLIRKRIVKNALNYNFDPLLQETLVRVFDENPVNIKTRHDSTTPNVRDEPSSAEDGKDGKPRQQEPQADAGTRTESAERPSKPDDSPLFIDHVHGFVRRPGCDLGDPAVPENSREIIFTESSYRDAERVQQYGWSSTTQATYFLQHTCVAVGFTAEDQNFRRIVSHLGRHPAGDGEGHYIFVSTRRVVERLTRLISEKFSADSPEHQCEIMRAALNIYASQQEAYWKTYGFRIVWSERALYSAPIKFSVFRPCLPINAVKHDQKRGRFLRHSVYFQQDSSNCAPSSAEIAKHNRQLGQRRQHRQAMG